MAQSAGKKPNTNLRPSTASRGSKGSVKPEYFDQLIELVGIKKLIKVIGLDGIVAGLSPAQRRELKRRLK